MAPHLHAYMPQLQKWRSNCAQLARLGLATPPTVCPSVCLCVCLCCFCYLNFYCCQQVFFFPSNFFFSLFFFYYFFLLALHSLILRHLLWLWLWRCPSPATVSAAVVVVEFHTIFLANCWRFLRAWSMDAKQSRACSFSSLQHSHIHTRLHAFIHSLAHSLIHLYNLFY